MIFTYRFLGLFLCCLAFGGAHGREWVTGQGRVFEAEFVGVSGADVLFQNPAGKRFTVAVKELSGGDQGVIRKLAGGAVESVYANFGGPWPREARPNGNPVCRTISEDAKKGVYIYESAGYRFYADARITHDALSNFATVFESTRGYLGSLPIAMMKGETESSRSKVLLFGEAEGYYRAGGVRGSAGCYIPKSRLVLVPMSSLGLVRGGTGFSRDLEKDDGVLIHELVHQLTPSAYYAHGARGWFSEGLAEYVSVTPYSTGYFRVDPHGNAVKEYVTAYGEGGKNGRRLGTKIFAPPLRYLMLMSYAEFAGSNGNRNYGLGLLLTHYFFHMEGGGGARRMTSFLKGLKAGKYGEEALAPLLGGGSYEKLEGEISAAWGRKGIELNFGGK